MRKREIPATGILQDWVAKLGLRHQGVLLTSIRGCDTAPKSDPSKDLTRAIRGVLLYTHVADEMKSGSFIEVCDQNELYKRFTAFRKNLDHYPHHFVMHIVHTVEIIGYYLPGDMRNYWHAFYLTLCAGLHMSAECKEELDFRLNADEETFVE